MIKILDDYYVAEISAPVSLHVKAMISLLHCIADVDSIDEAKSLFSRWATKNTEWLIEGLNGIEMTLANPPEGDGNLANIVAWEANWVLEDETDEGAKKWLREIAEIIRKSLGEKVPPRLKCS